MKAPVLATNLSSTLLWLLLVLVFILLALYLVWLFTRKRRKEGIERAEAARAPEAAPAPAVEAVPPAAPVAEGPVAPEPEVPRAPVAEAPADDLTRIEGIGPKVAQFLASLGITTFRALAEADAGWLK
ncbi:MAG: hypothetical protein D6793_01035, partial [Thermoflexia bacterium]